VKPGGSHVILKTIACSASIGEINAVQPCLAVRLKAATCHSMT